jgi:vancomycin permeability regulator SanA
MKATAQTPHRVSFGHIAILRSVIDQTEPDHPDHPQLPVSVAGERKESTIGQPVAKRASAADNYAEPVRRVRPMTLAVTAVLSLFSVAVGGSVLFVRHTAVGRIFSVETVPPAPAALVLGAQVYPDGTPSAFLAARLDLARQLYRAGKVRMILVSGDSTAPEYDEPGAMRSYLIAAGIPASDVIIDDAGIDTYRSCVRAREVFDVSDLIVVTQSYHLPRAVATCVRVGVNASGVGDDSARQYARSWRSGAIRDQLACVKTVLDLVIGRRPALGQG